LEDDWNSAYGDGCVGVALKGDIQVKVSVAQGAKPVGGVYRVVSGQDSTIAAIQLDEAATQLEDQSNNDYDNDDNEEDDDDDDNDDDDNDDEDVKKKKQIAQAYAKASIPKPVLAEANYLMKTLSDDDRAFMSRALLVGLERGAAMAQSPSQLVRLAQGKGHSFTVHQVASAGMKDGSITLPLGKVSIDRGTRLRFFVREGKFAKKELEALWTGYKKQIFEETFLATNDDNNNSDVKKMFTPTGCIILTTLDRGSKLFGGKPGYESSVVSDFLPSIPSISGFYSNGVIAKLDNQRLLDNGDDDNNNNDDTAMIHGSASCFALFGTKSGRPVYSPSQAAAIARRKAQEEAKKKKADLDKDNDNDDDDELLQQPAAVVSAITESSEDVVAPRDENNELILRRREVHSGRALTVSTVEWSVAENVATPTSVLESFMWEKETEVDRLRERVPLANLVSQWKLSLVDPSLPKPRDWIAPIKHALLENNNKFVLIPECKRMEPTTGSLRKRYNLSKLVKQLTIAGAPALSVNCDAILYGGKLDDITTAREASTSAALSLLSKEDDDDDNDGVVSPPILASDLILYPYQLYKLRLAGADATNLQVAALEDKDLLYMTKIATSLKMQLIATVTSEIQIQKVTKLSPDNNSIRALVVSNRDMESFSFDETGQQALRLLKSSAMEEFRAKHKDVLILVEGKVGIIQRAESEEGEEMTSAPYIQELMEANADGAIVGSGLAMKKEDDAGAAMKGILMDVQQNS
jgi:indole-3-glycerol phosphate synthase